MFPGLLQKDPEMLEGIVNKVMSTTEITKHLVGQKANFACMKKVGRLIPTDKVSRYICCVVCCQYNVTVMLRRYHALWDSLFKVNRIN